MPTIHNVSFWTRITFFLLPLFALGCQHTVAVRSVNLKHSIGSARQITIEGTLGGAGTVLVNPNRCSLDQFGDPGICTLMAFQRIEVRFEQIDVADEAGRRRRVYQIIGNYGPRGNPWLPDYTYYLVVPASRQDAYRLVVDDGQNKRAITLELK